MEAVILSMAFQVVKAVIKNPKKKAALKKQLLLIRDAISATFPED